MSGVALFLLTPPVYLAPQVPDRTQSRPVSIAALEGEQMWKPEYHAVNRTGHRQVTTSA